MSVTILAIAIKVAVSTALIYLSIQIVDRGNYRNTLGNALIFTIALTALGYVPLMYLVGLVVWVYILINWYSMGFFQSFLCVFVYAILMLILNIVLAAALLGGTFAASKMLDVETTKSQWVDFTDDMTSKASYLYRKMLRKLGIQVRNVKSSVKATVTDPDEGKVMIKLKNGRSMKARIVEEGNDWYLLDIADGRVEATIAKDQVESVTEIKAADREQE